MHTHGQAQYLQRTQVRDGFFQRRYLTRKSKKSGIAQSQHLPGEALIVLDNAYNIINAARRVRYDLDQRCYALA